MSCGLSILTLDIHGAKKFILSRAGIKILVSAPNTTVTALANKIEYLYHHPQARIAMRKVAYDFAQTQTWSNKVCWTSKSYNQLVAKSI